MGGAIPLLRGVEGCVIEHIDQHTLATTHPNAPPLKRGAVIIIIFSISYCYGYKMFNH
jgi:hypothetical protein